PRGPRPPPAPASPRRGRTAGENQQMAGALRRHVWPLLEAGKCKPLIYASYPMAEIAEAPSCGARGTPPGEWGSPGAS
ncbi:hypothetical protein M8371_33450, partial [Klebsiella pneumoniae]|nr:hypothetical protein [Klebsiella pneumoniae]